MTAQCKCFRCSNTLTMAEVLEEWCIVCQSAPRFYSSTAEIKEGWARVALVAAQYGSRGSRKVPN